MPEIAPATSPDGILRGAERCVACGLCLPVCPTYRLTQDETESPRGRIALMRALVHGDLAPSSGLVAHLQHCLDCRACERACPSGVPYGQLIDTAHGLIAARHAPANNLRHRFETLLARLVASPSALHHAARLLYGYQRSGLQALLRASGLLHLLGLKKVEQLLPRLTRAAAPQAFYPATAECRGAVALFTGCIAGIMDATTRRDAVRLLTALGYDVHLPPNQGCCGALALRTGDSRQAEHLMQRNLAAFAPSAASIITTASGCGALLWEYGRHLGGPAAAAFSERVTDIGAFLLRADWQAIRLRPLAKRVAVHDPCTLANVLRQEQAPYALLRKIPEAEITPLPENRFCCGGAGAYPLTQPGMAARLRADKVRQLRAADPDILVTSNIGCALQLGAGLRAAGLRTELLHPVSVLARQLPDR